MAAIERGEKWPRTETIERITDALDVAANDLLNSDNRVPYDINKLARELINDFEAAVGKTVRKMNSVVNSKKS